MRQMGQYIFNSTVELDKITFIRVLTIEERKMNQDDDIYFHLFEWIRKEVTFGVTEGSDDMVTMEKKKDLRSEIS